MTRLGALFVCVYSLSSFASSIPSLLPNGKYSMECKGVAIEKLGSQGEIRQNSYSYKGTSEHHSFVDFATVRDTYIVDNEVVPGQNQDIYEKSFKSLGDGHFEETVRHTNQFFPFGDGKSLVQALNQKSLWKRTFLVDKNTETNVMVQWQDGPERMGRGQTVVNALADGSFVIEAHLRGLNSESAVDPNIFPPNVTSLLIKSSCKYSPLH